MKWQDKNVYTCMKTNLILTGLKIDFRENYAYSYHTRERLGMLLRLNIICRFNNSWIW